MIVSVQIISEIRPMISRRDDAIGGNGTQGFPEGIERAGADIAIDDADGTERQPEKFGQLLLAGTVRLFDRVGHQLYSQPFQRKKKKGTMPATIMATIAIG